jgi:rhodanese-related sulfurtransferase
LDYINYVFIALFILFILYRFMPTKGVRNISTVELKNELKDKSKLFIDVRTPGEFKGKRSGQASKLLKKLGYTKVTNVKGGMNAWS